MLDPILRDSDSDLCGGNNFSFKEDARKVKHPGHPAIDKYCSESYYGLKKNPKPQNFFPKGIVFLTFLNKENFILILKV